MTPKTQLQKQVYRIYNKLPKLSRTIISWTAKNAFEHYVHTTQKENVCYTCGKSFTGKHNKCPYCRVTIKEHSNKRRRKHREVTYLKVITTFKEFQVIRCFHVTEYLTLHFKQKLIFHEVYQHWILPDKGNVVLTASKQGFGGWGYNDGWCLGSELQVRPRGSDSCYINYGVTYPHKKFVPEVRRNGYDGNIYEMNFDYYLIQLLCNNAFESLLKMGEYDIIKTFWRYEYDFKRFWRQYILCRRNNYKINDLQMWFDHMKLLRYFKKDMLSPKYICPANLKHEHQILIERKRKIDIAREIERKRKAAEEELRKDIELRKRYVKQKRKFFKLTLEEEGLYIVPLKSIDEFIEEGRIMHHCVYNTKYYDNKDTLILSARKDNERIETIEFSLREFKVLQARGVCNENSNYHDKILEILEKNVEKIRAIA